jgi:hypothetical protein
MHNTIILKTVSALVSALVARFLPKLPQVAMQHTALPALASDRQLLA